MKQIKIFTLKELRQLLFFILCGGTAFVILVAATYVLTEVVGLWYLISYGISIFISWTVSFYLNRKLTFNYKGDNTFSVYKKFIFLYILAGGINFGLVYLLTDYFGLYYLASIIIVAFFITISTFYINKNIIFKTD